MTMLSYAGGGPRPAEAFSEAIGGLSGGLPKASRAFAALFLVRAILRTSRAVGVVSPVGTELCGGEGRKR